MHFLFQTYEVNGVTWFWLSVLLTMAVFFRFHRLWSIRNLDLILLLGLTPGLLMIRNGMQTNGYIWLFTATGILLIRLGVDPFFQRRPRIEPNLNASGLGFLCLAVSGFLITKVITEPPDASSVDTIRHAEDLIQRKDASKTRPNGEAGPASSLVATPVVTLSQSLSLAASRVLALLAHVAVVLGLIFVGRWHFHDHHTGVAMATLYLLLPCTAFDVQKAIHVLPSALIVWAFVAYRKPMLAGSLLGLACGSLFFPLFLLPLWLSFYDRQGALRFGMALVLVAAVLLGTLVLTSADTHSFTQQTIGSINWSVLEFQGARQQGFWAIYNGVYRLPVFCTFVVILSILSFWPRKKNLEHLMAHSATIVVAIQFWYPQQGGVYLLWYVPLVLMVAFRPRLSHLVPPEIEAKNPSKTMQQELQPVG